MSSTTTMLAARAEELTKTYGSGRAAVTALAGVSIEVPVGTFTSVMGPSGSGKSTLMHCMAGLDSVTSGQVWIGGEGSSGGAGRGLARGRRGPGGVGVPGGHPLPRPSGAPETYD